MGGLENTGSTRVDVNNAKNYLEIHLVIVA